MIVNTLLTILQFYSKILPFLPMKNLYLQSPKYTKLVLFLK